MDTVIIDKIIEIKNLEIKELYDVKICKNKKMTDDIEKIDYNTKVAINNIKNCLNKKLKSSKIYKKKLEEELLDSAKNKK